jgi:hypothetical protein
MSAPVKLVAKPTADEEVCKSVVTLLTDALAHAEAGEIDTVLLIAHYVDGEWSDAFSDTNRYSETIGRLEIAKHEWIANYLRKEG